MSERKIISRNVTFKDAHNFVIESVVEEPLKNQNGEVVAGGVKHIYTEEKDVKSIRESQEGNYEALMGIEDELTALLANKPTPPEEPSAKLREFMKLQEEAKKYLAAKNTYDSQSKKLQDTKRALRRAHDAIELCNLVMTKRREQFPDASVEDGDLIDLTGRITPPKDE